MKVNGGKCFSSILFNFAEGYIDNKEFVPNIVSFIGIISNGNEISLNIGYLQIGDYVNLDGKNIKNLVVNLHVVENRKLCNISSNNPANVEVIYLNEDYLVVLDRKIVKYIAKEDSRDYFPSSGLIDSPFAALSYGTKQGLIMDYRLYQP